MAAVLTFEAEGHVYKLDGQRLPSVTQALELLEDFSAVPAAVLEAARVFGSHVHNACALDLRRQLDWRALDHTLVPYVEGLRRFVKDSGIVILASELRVHHQLIGYAGTLDIYGLLEGRQALVDIKSGLVPRTVGPQTAAYERALIDSRRMRVRSRYCLQLNPEFPCGYKLHLLKDRTDWSMFLSALNCLRFRKNVTY